MSLKVFDLQCESGHVFEGWFASTEAYETQRDGGLLSCPFCESKQVSKMLSAPRLNMGKGREPAASSSQAASEAQSGEGAPTPTPAQMQAQVLQFMRHMLRNTDNVGDRFAQEARRMHEGEIEQRAIRGTATREERAELLEEGIAVVPVPDFLDDDRLQ
ncbi:DUF1178 family protein [Pusillimonas sp. CC-YST705]|uniref:DUF1178 family protein n=1 Tax=Mesopusillimonas faecipullorum TaxID=2755040 RepID=A0ABS8C8P2_9BURK|nr:DUF1178 family protein [Mesopusillimonas faecipullorum]MCB5362237.1 DUF1178 family protein [Mesopusillimonas faecipullorum]